MGKSSLKKTVSHVTREVKSFLKDAVDAPPEEKVEVPEELSEEKCELPLVEETERELEFPVDKGQEILAELNSATSRWKETGDLQIHFAPFVPFTTRVKTKLRAIKEF